jgi:hypothetical protein
MALDTHTLAQALPLPPTPGRRHSVRLRRWRPPAVAAAPVPAAAPAGPLPLTAGQVLKAWRKARRLSLVEVEQVAELCGAPLGHTTASRIERGDPGTSVEKYRAYLRVLTEWEAKPNA